MLADAAAVLGPRAASVARELTKLHEEHRRGRLPELAAAYAASGPPKGEVVVVIGPPEADAGALDDDAVDAAAARGVALGEAARRRGRGRRCDRPDAPTSSTAGL